MTDDNATAAIIAADRAGNFAAEVQKLHPMKGTPRSRMVLALQRGRRRVMPRQVEEQILGVLDTLTNDQCAVVERAMRERFSE